MEVTPVEIKYFNRTMFDLENSEMEEVKICRN